MAKSSVNSELYHNYIRVFVNSMSCVNAEGKNWGGLPTTTCIHNLLLPSSYVLHHTTERSGEKDCSTRLGNKARLLLRRCVWRAINRY